MSTPITLRSSIPDEGEFYSIDPWIADAVLETERCRGRVLALTPDARQLRRVWKVKGQQREARRATALRMTVGRYVSAHRLSPGNLEACGNRLMWGDPHKLQPLTYAYIPGRVLPLVVLGPVAPGSVLVCTLPRRWKVLRTAADHLTRAGWCVTLEEGQS